MLVAGQLYADDGDGRHEARQHGADPRDVVVNVHDDVLGHRPHIIAACVGRSHGGKGEGGAQQHRRHGVDVNAGELGAQMAPEIFFGLHDILLWYRPLKGGG